MKKFFTYTLTALMSLLVFTSCDSDAELAYDLDGTWSGSLSSEFYNYRFGQYMTDEYDTEITFYQRGEFSRGGSGEEYDYNLRTREYTYVAFDWTVRNGRIYISYDDGSDIMIRDYDIYGVGYSQRFRGYFENYHTGETLAAFNLSKVNSRTRAAGSPREGFTEVPKAEFK